MRYREQSIQPPKKKVEEKPARELPKAGKYTPKDLGDQSKNWKGWDIS